jgi:hypothetical protein
MYTTTSRREVVSADRRHGVQGCRSVPAERAHSAHQHVAAGDEPVHAAGVVRIGNSGRQLVVTARQIGEPFTASAGEGRPMTSGHQLRDDQPARIAGSSEHHDPRCHLRQATAPPNHSGKGNGQRQPRPESVLVHQGLVPPTKRILSATSSNAEARTATPG